MNQLLFEQFVVADSSNVLCKNIFNELKKNILNEEGIYTGFETIVLREFCHHCNGKAEKYIKKIDGKGKYVPCLSCKTTGYKRNETRYYKRFALHGMIFKMRTPNKPTGEPVQILQGYPKQDYAEPATAYRAMLILFSFYNEQLLTRLLTYAFPAQDIWAKEKDQILQLIEKQKAA